MKKVKVILAVMLITALVGAFSITIGGPANPLMDRVDAVMVKGKSLPGSILGASAGKYRLFSAQGAKLTPIPFQIDEFNANGAIILKQGPKASKDSDNGAFDKNDLLIFMASDASGKSMGKPKVLGCESFAEITIADTKSKKTGYAYLAKCSKPPAASTKKYVKWDAAKNTLVTKSYKMGWQEKGLRYYYDYLSVFNGPDILDRLKVRIAVGFKGMHLKIHEERFKNNIQGYTVGPIRMSYVNLAQLSLGPIGKIPVHMRVYWYRNWIYLNNILDSSVNPASMGLDYQVRIIHDLKVDRKRNYKICTSALPKCMAITGKVTPQMKEISKKPQQWGGVIGPEGAIMTRLIMDPDLHTKSMGFYLDDDKAKRKPEYHPGSGPEVAFYIVDWKDAKDGPRYLDFYHYIMKKYSPALVKRFSRITSQPLKVKASAI